MNEKRLEDFFQEDIASGNIGEKYREYGKLFQDQIYGTKVLTPLAVAVVDTPEFQRLAGMKQLGFSDVMYRGAQHSRFCHSIGTYFLTRTIMRRIVQNHERLDLGHPGKFLPDCYSQLPYNAYSKKEDVEKVKNVFSNQSKWRGLTEVVSISALLHDIGHVPFGHTLEDEFTGIYERHDTLGGPRLYEMLFNEQSILKRKVFTNMVNKWIDGPGKKRGIENEKLAQLIYVILSWKERIHPPSDFKRILKEAIKNAKQEEKTRLDKLLSWFEEFNREKMFHPFMSDIIGNTICADLLDYLPRDRMNLGMEHRIHSRIQRYLTIREGQLYEGEGKRVSIIVTRRGRGGQRRDVATAVLDIMRERYEMAERVYYHHKKAAISTMLGKLAELCKEDGKLPDDKESIYPAPWDLDQEITELNNIIHFSDITFIDRLGTAKLNDDDTSKLQRKLWIGIRYDRKMVYRTLLVVDTDLVQMSARPISYFSKDLREDENGKASYIGRKTLEKELAAAAGVEDGEVLIYCPSSDMQSKEVDARMEIVENRVLPLSVQKESFTYQADVRVLEQYYQQLWKIYLFVSPDLYEDYAACKEVVDRFCQHYKIEKMLAYDKVRGYKFKIDYDVIASRAVEPLRVFFWSKDNEGLPFRGVPSDIIEGVMSRAAKDDLYLRGIKSGTGLDAQNTRIASIFDLVILDTKINEFNKDTPEYIALRERIDMLAAGTVDSILLLDAARSIEPDSMFKDGYEDYTEQLLASVVKQ
jgi:uncharacterized protein